MLHTRFRSLVLIVCGVLPLLSGCLALSFGGKSQQVDTVMSDTPQTLERLSKLESRIDAIEQQFAPPPVIPNGGQ